jgi:hypothetical protein
MLTFLLYRMGMGPMGGGGMTMGGGMSAMSMGGGMSAMGMSGGGMGPMGMGPMGMGGAMMGGMRSGPMGMGVKRPPEARPGDWDCPRCYNLNFSSR